MKGKFTVASAHPLSTNIGMKIMEKGGNSYDAAIAVSAALTVVQPNLNGLGGDMFAIVKDGTVSALNGSGPASEMATVDFFRKSGLNEIPNRGSLSSFSIPGLASSWQLLHERCTMRFSELVVPAADLAKSGFRISAGISWAIGRMKGYDSDWEGIYKPAEKGGILYQAALGKTLERIGHDDAYGFYHGDIAKQIEEDMIAKGGLMRFSDLDSYSAQWVDPMRVRYRGYDVYTNPPPSQGVTSLMWLNMLDRVSLGSMNVEDYYEELIGKMLVAYDYRSRYIADPTYVRFPAELLEKNAVYDLPGLKGKAPEKNSDTTAFSVYDGETGISAIQSNYMGFGSGHSIKSTGINMNNRGCYFTLNPEHHNALMPGKKTFHTLMAVYAQGEKQIFLGTMGGDVQPQINVQILSGIIDLGRRAQEAVAYPRYVYPASIYGDADIYYEESLHLGKYTQVKDNNSMTGHAQAIVVGETTEPGFDPRGDGLLSQSTTREG